MLLVGLASLLAATLVGVSAGQNLGRSILDDAIGASRSSGAQEVSSQLDYYRELAGRLAGSPQTAVAVEEFADGLDELGELSSADVADTRQQLLESYETRFFEPLREAGQVVQLRDVLTVDPAALYLQGAYSVPQPPVTNPATVNDAGDGSAWSAAHAEYHPVYNTALREGRLRDVYLIDAASERIVYSSAKGPDLGTSLVVGPYSGTIVARAADAGREAGQPIATDLAYYRGAPDGPIGAASAPVRGAGGSVVGSVVVTYDADVLTEAMTDLVEAFTVDEAQSGGDMYLIGSDGVVRSDPQSFLTSAADYLDSATEAGVLSEEDRAGIERAGTTVLVQPAVEGTVNAAREGVSEPMSGTGVDGSEVVVGTEAVEDDDVTWYVARELDADKAASTVAAFRRILLVGSAVFVVVLAFASVAWARWFMRPVRVISERLADASQAELSEAATEPVKVPDRSSVELHGLAASLTSMAQILAHDQRAVRDARAERLAVLRRMLPESIAARVDRGDLDTIEEVPQATVVVVVVLGLGSLSALDTTEGRRVVDDLHAEIDDIAASHGLDRIAVVGDAYFAACGHDQPYIDHAPRAVAFAAEIAETVSAAGAHDGAALQAATAVATGPVTVGMSGRDMMVYDVWGPTVSTAHTLARCARGGEVLVTGRTRQRLPDDVRLVPWEATALLSDAQAQGATADVWALPATESAVSGSDPGGAR
jgi:class 3 adenylate cyclase